MDVTKTVLRDPKYAKRMKMTFELFDFAESVMRQNLSRRHPEASKAELDARFRAWLHKTAYVASKAEPAGAP